VIYLTVADLLHIAERVLRAQPVVRDAGLLEAACARPAASVFGADAYPTLDLKASALVHSLARNHALVDGNKRLALGGLIGFLGLNGRCLLATNDEAYELIVAIATGELDDVGAISKRLEHGATG
jgi:death-on-curing protein